MRSAFSRLPSGHVIAILANVGRGAVDDDENILPAVHAPPLLGMGQVFVFIHIRRVGAAAVFAFPLGEHLLQPRLSATLAWQA